MSREDENEAVSKVLSQLNNIASASVNQNKQVVNMLVSELSLRLQDETGILKGATIKHSGSAYENLAIDKNADFDLILELGKPFVSGNFQITQARQFKYIHFRLHNKMTISKKSKKKMFCSNKGNLKTEELRYHIFERLDEILHTIDLKDVSAVAFPKLAAMQVNLRIKNGSKVELDLTPQIVACTWDECPGLVPRNNLPPCLNEYIESNTKHNSPILYFTPAILTAQRPLHYGICSMVSFSLLEKQFLKKEANIHDMVRLAKVIKDNRSWTAKFGLKSFHLKRMAIKYASSLRTKATFVTQADTYVHLGVDQTGGAANHREIAKSAKYRRLEGQFTFVPIASEMHGPWGKSALGFLKKLGSKLIHVTRDPRAASFLFQRLSVAIQRGTACCILGSCPEAEELQEIHNF
ncbi:uncharacterized protein [Procambarus clarkii]|uniref:uncharacterized protein isoform X3 n=1 Tax=Procambarus clarkii TaxID=6728 RepID=UPI00374220A8